MAKKIKKQSYKQYLIALLFLVAVLGIFLYFRNHNQVNKEESVSTSYKDSKTVTIESILPISDELGKTIDGKGTEDGIQGYVELSITNNINKDIEYEIYIDKKDLDKEISSNYIKFYLTDEADNPLEGYKQNSVPTYKDLLVLVDSPSSRLLYSDKLKAKETKKVILRVWLSDSYVVSNEINKFTFDINTKAK